eukprot:7516334-Alexandrium_andersonii.AAC.1
MCIRDSIPPTQVDELHVAVDHVRVNVNALLHPQLGDRKAPDAANPGAPANPNCRAAVGANFKGGSKTKVLGNGHEAEALGCSLDDAGQLCLPESN